MTHTEAVFQFHRAGAFAIIGNLLAYWACHLLRQRARVAEFRSTVRKIMRLDRVEAASFCEGCGRRKRHGHEWFCIASDVPFFNDHYNLHDGIRRHS